jgi:hypothetical protein
MYKKYPKRELGNDSINYIQDCLHHGSTISKKVLKKINFNKGIFFTFLPLNVTEKEALKFDIGGKLVGSNKKIEIDSDLFMIEKPNCNLNLADEIRDHLQQKTENICVIENYLAKPDDPWLNRATSNLFFFEEEVYHLLLSNDADKDIILNTISESSSIPIFIGFMTSIDPNIQKYIGCKQYIKEEILTIMADRAEKIFVGAYDGEGYLIWSQM